MGSLKKFVDAILYGYGIFMQAGCRIGPSMGARSVLEEPMSKRKTNVMESFGPRLATLRKAAGYTQVEFAGEVGMNHPGFRGDRLV